MIKDFKTLQFKRLETTDIPDLGKALYQSNSLISAYNLINLFAWDKKYKFYWCIFDHSLYIYRESDGNSLMPVGKKISVEDLISYSDYQIANNLSGNFIFVTDDLLEKDKPLLQRSFLIKHDRDNADYIYLTKKLSELKGDKLNKKRNLIKQFKKNYPDIKIKELIKKDFKKTIDLVEKWANYKQDGPELYKDELTAIDMTFSLFDELKASGLSVIYKEKIIAFTIYNRQNNDCATVHFEKFDPEFKGLSQLINQETNKILTGEYLLINREQDLGIAGLRKAKLSYAPEKILSTFCLIRTG